MMTLHDDDEDDDDFFYDTNNVNKNDGLWVAIYN